MVGSGGEHDRIRPEKHQKGAGCYIGGRRESTDYVRMRPKPGGKRRPLPEDIQVPNVKGGRLIDYAQFFFFTGDTISVEV